MSKDKLQLDNNTELCLYTANVFSMEEKKRIISHVMALKIVLNVSILD